MIGSEICAAILSILCVYHYFASHCDGMVIFFAVMFAVMAVLCHKIQKSLRFDIKLWK